MKKLLIVISILLLAGMGQAVTYELIKEDAGGSSSLLKADGVNAGGGWLCKETGQSQNFPTAENDYVVQNVGGVRSPAAKLWYSTYKNPDGAAIVPCKSMTLRTSTDKISSKPSTLITKHWGSAYFTINNLILENGLIAISDNSTTDDKNIKRIGGKITVNAGYDGYIGSSITAKENNGRYLISRAAFAGDGNLVFRLAGDQVGITHEGDASAFTGPVYVGHNGVKSDTAPGGGKVTFAAGSVWFGAMTVFNANGFTVNGGGKVVFDENVASDANRGWTLNGNPELNVAAEKTVAVAAPVAGAGFKKAGTGVLELAGAAESLSGPVAVNAGTLKASDPSALGAAALAFAADAALEIDVTKGALVLASAPSGLARLTASGTAEGEKIPVLTYQGEEIDVAAIEFTCGFSGASADAYKLVSESSEGTTTIFAVNTSSDAYAFSIAAEVKTVTMDSATFTVTLSVAEGVDVGDAIPAVTGVYGATAGGTAVENWEHAVDFSKRTPGVYELTLSNLAQDSTYSVAFTAFAEGYERCWSGNLRISTGGITVRGPSFVYENDVRPHDLVVSRPVEASSDAVTVALSYSDGVELLVSPLPETVTLESGESSKVIPFTVFDNTTADGDAEFTVTVVASDTYVRGNPFSATVRIIDDESLEPAECVWTGAGDGMSWADAANWSGGKPRSVDTAKFTADGITAKQTVTLTENEIVRAVLTDGSPAFTLSSAGASLALGSIEVTKASGDLTVAAPLLLMAGSETNCIWNIDESRTMTINAELSKQDGVYVFKTGAGNVNMSYQNTTFSGPWIIREGTITANVEQGKTFRGTVTIGGGDKPAKLYQSKKNSITGTTIVNVYTNGTYQSGDIDNGRAATIRVYEGGLATVGNYYYMEWLTLQGGTFRGGTTWNSCGITAVASGKMSVLDASWRFMNNNYSVSVARGTAPVDLLISKSLTEGGTDVTITKTGDGIVKSTVNFGGLKDHFKISGGTWLVDNPSEYGLGIQECTVAKGAVIGGTGFVGMKESKDGSTLTLSDGDATSFATIAPGTIDTATGLRVNGTLTVAREAAHNALSLGKFAHLVIGVGPNDAETKVPSVDKLMVHGTLNIGADCTLDLMSNNTFADVDGVRGGTFTIVEAEDGINGTFATIKKPKRSWKVVQETNRIVLTIPNCGMMVIVK